MDVVQVLVQAGADCNKADVVRSCCMFFSLRDSAGKSSFWVVFFVLLQKGRTPLMSAVETAQADIAGVLIKAGARVNIVDEVREILSHVHCHNLRAVTVLCSKPTRAGRRVRADESGYFPQPGSDQDVGRCRR
jgi:non-ribosomal peptide synthetase component E (peptide arylation enzyme)